MEEREYGKLEERVEYLVKCCEEVRGDINSSKTRQMVTLTSVVMLLIGVVINIIMNYAK